MKSMYNEVIYTDSYNFSLMFCILYKCRVFVGYIVYLFVKAVNLIVLLLHVFCCHVIMALVSFIK